MRITVFGSTGATFPCVLREAIARGHEVTAFAQHPDAWTGVTGLVAAVVGDARDVDAASKTITSQGAVIVTIRGRGRAHVGRDVARAVTVAMDSVGVSRLVAASTYGLVATRPLAGLTRRMFAEPVGDQRSADQVIQATDLAWTIARAGRLTSATSIRPPRISREPFRSGPHSVGQASWARVLVDLAQYGGFNRQIVHVTS